MTLIGLLVTLAIFGLILWAVNNYVPMDEKIKGIINIVAIIGVLLWLLQAFGLLSNIGDVRLR